MSEFIKYNWLILSLCLIGLSGCISTDTFKPPVMTIYDFGPPEPSYLAKQPWKRLALDISSPYRFDKAGIAYRLIYDNPNILYNYTESRWSTEPTILLKQRLGQALGLDDGHGTCRIHVIIDEFSQHIKTPKTSEGVVQGRAFLVDESQTIRAELTINEQVPAPSIDAAGAVSSLTAASNQMSFALGQWLEQLQQKNSLADC